MALDAVAGAAGVAVAMLLRFVDETSVPATYAQRLVPWLVLAALIQVGVGEAMNRLRKPGSALARRPVARCLVATVGALVLVLAINDLVLREPWRLPHLVAIVGPLLAAAGSAALRLAAARPIDVEELLSRPIVQLNVEACAAVLAGKRVLITGGAGSICSQLPRQGLTGGPAAVLIVDTNETGLFELEGDLAAQPGSVAVRTTIADVTDPRRIRELFL